MANVTKVLRILSTQIGFFKILLGAHKACV